MMKFVIALAALSLAANAAPAQMPGSAAKAAAQKAAAAANAHTEAEQNTEQQKQQPAGAKTQAPTKGAPAQTKAAPAPAPQKGAAQKAPVAKAPAGKAAATQKTAPKTPAQPAVPAADTAGPPPTILREAYAYASEGRRDPFNSLLTTNELRPTLSDLRITGILYDAAGRRSTATLRDLVTNAQYRITSGSILGRMRVTAIRPKIIVFTIDEFGTTRQDSLVFGDTTKARVK